MLNPSSSKLGRKYDLRPAHAAHHMLKVSPPAVGAYEAILHEVDHRPLLTPVRDQGQEGSCFAHAAAALKEFNCAVWGGGTTPLGGYLSVSYLSWRTRVAEGTFPADSGASLADAMSVLQSWGVCPETFLPYDQDPGQAGNAGCDVAARPYRIGTPCTVNINPTAFQAVLSAQRVICVGFEVYQSFEDTGPAGIVPPVKPGEGQLGGHAVLVVGYKQIAGVAHFIVRNSWGSWADGGYCYWPAEYLSNVFEAWTASAV